MKAVVNLGATVLQQRIFFCAKPILYTWCSHPPNPHSVWKRWRRETWDALESGLRVPTWTALHMASSGGWVQNPCVGRSASEPVPSGFASHVGSVAASQPICVKAWEPSFVIFYQKSGRVDGKLTLDLVAIGKPETYHADRYFSIFSAGRNVKPCELYF